MSKPRATIAQPVPTGILVSKGCRPPERPTPKRPTATRARQTPWLLIVTAGSIAWSALFVATGLYLSAQERTPPSKRATVEAPVPKVEVALKPASKPIVLPLDEPDPMQFVDAPLLLRRDLFARHVDAPPLLEFAPEAVEPAIHDTPVIALKPGKKEIDLNVYANCEQIGTNILFVKDPPDAFKKAKAEKKLVFVVHLSGNLEDRDFT